MALISDPSVVYRWPGLKLLPECVLAAVALRAMRVGARSLYDVDRYLHRAYRIASGGPVSELWFMSSLPILASTTAAQSEGDRNEADACHRPHNREIGG